MRGGSGTAGASRATPAMAASLAGRAQLLSIDTRYQPHCSPRRRSRPRTSPFPPRAPHRARARGHVLLLALVGCVLVSMMSFNASRCACRTVAACMLLFRPIHWQRPSRHSMPPRRNGRSLPAGRTCRLRDRPRQARHLARSLHPTCTVSASQR